MAPFSCLSFIVLWLTALNPVALATTNIPSTTISTGTSMPSVMVGTWTSGTTEDAKSIVRTWLTEGGRGIDEALVYGNQGQTAQAILESGIPRSELFIESKIPSCGGHQMARSWIHQCLSQLNVTYLDLLLIHAPRGPDCLGTWRVLEEFHRQGILKAIGVSNFQVTDLLQILTNGKVVPAVNQIQFNIFYHDDSLVDFCKQHGITVQSWGPLGGAHHWFKRSVFTEPTVLAIAKAHQISPAQVALRWVIQHNVTFVFLSGDANHQATDADIFKFSLTDADMQQLNALPHQPMAVQQKNDASILNRMTDKHAMYASNFSRLHSSKFAVLAGSGISVAALVARLWILRTRGASASSNLEDLEPSSSILAVE